MTTLTTAQAAILKVVSLSDGHLGVKRIEAEMKALSGIPQSEWMPIREHLETLENLGLIRPEVTELGFSQYRMTERGTRLVYNSD
jgi:repressor of nif and glnA expression